MPRDVGGSGALNDDDDDDDNDDFIVFDRCLIVALFSLRHPPKAVSENDAACFPWYRCAINAMHVLRMIL